MSYDQVGKSYVASMYRHLQMYKNARMSKDIIMHVSWNKVQYQKNNTSAFYKFYLETTKCLVSIMAEIILCLSICKNVSVSIYDIFPVLIDCI